MKRQVVRLYQQFAALSEIWPGWKHWQTPVAFFTPDEAVLLAHPEPPAEFSLQYINGMEVYCARPAPQQFVANTAIDLNGHKTATIMWSERSQDAALALLAHEAFHAYQLQQGFPIAHLQHMMHYPAYDPVINALGEAEARLLSQALSHADDAVHLVREALNARAARQQLLREISKKRLADMRAVSEPGVKASRDLAEYEDYNELHEGLAVYIEMQVLKPGDKRWNNNVAKLQRLNHDGWGAERLRFYYSGMAYGLLCDSYAPGWHKQVLEHWTSPASILAHALNYQPNPENRSYSTIDFDRLLCQHRISTEERCLSIKTELKKYFDPHGTRVKVSFAATPVSGAWNPITSQLLPEGGRLQRDLLMYSYDSGSSLRVEHGAVERELARVIEYQKANLRITVDEAEVTGGKYCGAITITGRDSRLYVPHGRLEFDGGECRVYELRQGSSS